MSTTPGEQLIEQWMAAKGWTWAQFQRDTTSAYLKGQSGLLNAPTGSGKTYGLFLPALIEYVNQNKAYYKPQPSRLQVLWITPLRALTKDLQRNMQLACDELNIPWHVGVRTGDMSSAEKTLQKKALPEVLLITPESLHILFASKNNTEQFKHLRLVVADEWHELLSTKRGVQVELAFARLRALQPAMLSWGISATIGNLDQALQTLVGMDFPADKQVVIRSNIHKKVIVESVLPDHVERLPWAGYLGINLVDKVIPIVMQSKTTLLFTNTRSQTEIWFRIIAENYPELAGLVALHHGSLDRDIRNWVEENLHLGKLKLVVCTSSLDLGVDFRPVETVIQVGSPKSIARFLQRAGRSGHRPDATSKIYFVPTHTLELIEAVSLREGVEKDVMEERVPIVQAFDVLAQYMVTLAVGEGFAEAPLFDEVRSTHAFQYLNRQEWEWLLAFITTGGPSLTAYDEFKRVEKVGDKFVVKDRRTALRHRLNMGTIVSDSSIKIQYLSGKYLGSVEESFISRLKPGDVFTFAGLSLEFIRLHDMSAQVKKASSFKGTIPRWAGGRMPLSSKLSAFIRDQLDKALTAGQDSPEMTTMEPILKLQSERSMIPHAHELLIEQCETKDGYHIFIYPFEGRLVHEGLASLIGYRISKIQPITFSLAMNDYGFELLSDEQVDMESLLKQHDLFATEHLLDDIQRSINATELAKRKFREIASIAGLIHQGYPGRAVKTKHLQASSSLFFQVISDYEPNNLLLRQAFQEALDQQLEERRMRLGLERIHQQQIVIKHTPSPTPFAFPIMVDRLREQVTSEKLEDRVNKLIKQFEKDSGDTIKK